jgi:alanyl-tRNA synthetase
VPKVVDVMGQAFGEIVERAEHAVSVIQAEEESFGKTLDRGIELFEEVVQRVIRSGQRLFPGDETFRLYDTYGFPVDLTQLMAAERGLAIDMGEFERLMANQRERARAASRAAAAEAGEEGGLTIEKLSKTGVKSEFIGYDTSTVANAVVAGMWDENNKAVEHAEKGQKVQVLLDRTPFYGESGGQVGDTGWISSAKGRLEVETTVMIGEYTIHRCQVLNGSIDVGDKVAGQVSPTRGDTMRNHTSTHLLHESLRHVLGTHVQQAGSLVAPDYFRFDFTHFTRVTPQELRQIERRVNEHIVANFPVRVRRTTLEEAKKEGAMALFGEKYGEQVRMIEIDEISKELCGGTHCSATGQIGLFKVIAEESVASGVRRIMGVSGLGAFDYVSSMESTLSHMSHQLKVPPQELPDRIASLQDEIRKLRKQIEKGISSDVGGIVDQLIEKADKVGKTTIVVGQLPEVPAEQLRA